MALLDSLELSFDKADSYLVFIGKGPLKHGVDICFLYLQDVVFGLAVSLSGAVDFFTEFD